MIRILYLSQATKMIADEEIKNILQSSQRNNQELDITGVLVYGGGLFLQLLEGKEHIVLRQYVKIIDDKRHEDCRIIYISPANERLFEKWSMGVIQRSPLEFQHINELRAHRLESVQTKLFKNIMHEFVVMLRA